MLRFKKFRVIACALVIGVLLCSCSSSGGDYDEDEYNFGYDMGFEAGLESAREEMPGEDEIREEIKEAIEDHIDTGLMDADYGLYILEDYLENGKWYPKEDLLDAFDCVRWYIENVRYVD